MWPLPSRVRDAPRQQPHNLRETYQLPRVQLITADDVHRRCPKRVEFRDKIKCWILDASCWLFIRRFFVLISVTSPRMFRHLFSNTARCSSLRNRVCFTPLESSKNSVFFVYLNRQNLDRRREGKRYWTKSQQVFLECNKFSSFLLDVLFTLNWWSKTFEFRRIFVEFNNSLYITVLSCIVCVCVGGRPTWLSIWSSRPSSVTHILRQTESRELLQDPYKTILLMHVLLLLAKIITAYFQCCGLKRAILSISNFLVPTRLWALCVNRFAV